MINNGKKTSAIFTVRPGKIMFFAVFLFLISGCASLAKFIVGSKGLEIPQIVAYLEPVLRENTMTVLGKIVIRNPTESALDLDKIYLAVKDEHDTLLADDVLQWEKPTVTAREEIESPVRINLSLSALDKEYLSIFLKTAFTYKKFHLRIPVESKIAVLNLKPLKETIARPLKVYVYTKLRSNIRGASTIDYRLRITNPFSINVLLEEGIIRVHTEAGVDIVASRLPRTLFGGSQSNQIKGSIDIGNNFKKLIRSELSRKRPLRLQFSGNLRIPDTNIVMPFTIQSVQEINFSWSGR